MMPILSNGSDFAIVGKQNEYEFLELTQFIESDEEDLTDDDNLDFSMFKL